MRTLLIAVVAAIALATVAAGCGSSTPADRASTSAHRPSASGGCGSPDAAFAAQGDDGRFTSGDTERIFAIAAPDDAVGHDPLPLIINLHGARATAVEQQSSSGLDTRGPEAGFVVVAPQALHPRPIWSLTENGPDITFVLELVDEVEQRLCIDTSRVYLTGFSMGGMLSMRLACTAPQRFAAVAAVSGEIDYDDCPSSDRPPLLAFHGTDDGVVHFDGTLTPGISMSIPFPDEPPRDEIVRRWAQANNCTVPATETAVPPDVEHETYTCPAAGAVEMYVILGGGHTWPGSTPGPYSQALAGNTTQTIDATALILAFFELHARST